MHYVISTRGLPRLFVDDPSTKTGNLQLVLYVVGSLSLLRKGFWHMKRAPRSEGHSHTWLLCSPKYLNYVDSRSGTSERCRQDDLRSVECQGLNLQAWDWRRSLNWAVRRFQRIELVKKMSRSNFGSWGRELPCKEEKTYWRPFGLTCPLLRRRSC